MACSGCCSVGVNTLASQPGVVSSIPVCTSTNAQFTHSSIPPWSVKWGATFVLRARGRHQICDVNLATMLRDMFCIGLGFLDASNIEPCTLIASMYTDCLLVTLPCYNTLHPDINMFEVEPLICVRSTCVGCLYWR